MKKRTFTLTYIAQMLDAKVVNSSNPDAVIISGISTLSEAESKHITFLSNPSYKKHLVDTQAAAVMLHPSMEGQYQGVALILTDPYVGFAKVSQLFDLSPSVKSGIHPSAVVDETAVIGEDVCVGANVYIGKHVKIGAGCEIGANCTILDFTVIGENTTLHASVNIYHSVQVGSQCRFHSGSVIGADGFGYAPDNGMWHKIAQLGSVVIGDNVEVGANTTIDRGAIENTIVGNNVILDNHVMIAHNVIIGEGTAMAGMSGIAGSSTVGRNCIIAGGAAISGHIEVTDNVHIMAKALVSKSIKISGAYASGTTAAPIREWRKSATRFKQLDSMAKRITHLENDHKKG
jgi:UDP-3-O-[3-hydroxymyristoyl] glucosamine N-acyltransferase